MEWPAKGQERAACNKGTPLPMSVSLVNFAVNVHLAEAGSLVNFTGGARSCAVRQGAHVAPSLALPVAAWPSTLVGRHCRTQLAGACCSSIEGLSNPESALPPSQEPCDGAAIAT